VSDLFNERGFNVSFVMNMLEIISWRRQTTVHFLKDTPHCILRQLIVGGRGRGQESSMSKSKMEQASRFWEISLLTFLFPKSTRDQIFFFP